MSIKSALQDILISGVVPPDLVVTYDDLHGLWGGTTIVIEASDGTSRGRIRTARMGGDPQPQVWAATIAAHQLRGLVQLLVELQAWVQQTPLRQPVPDESWATLTIMVNGQTSCIREWVTEMAATQRLIRVKTRMSEIVSEGA